MTFGTAYAATAIMFCGLVLCLAAILFFWWLSWIWGREIFYRLRRCYHLTVIAYWLDRLEKHGVREFQKAELEDLARLRRK